MHSKRIRYECNDYDNFTKSNDGEEKIVFAELVIFFPRVRAEVRYYLGPYCQLTMVKFIESH